MYTALLRRNYDIIIAHFISTGILGEVVTILYKTKQLLYGFVVGTKAQNRFCMRTLNNHVIFIFSS